MTADQIRGWAAQGIEFGAHSRTHANLPTLSPSELEEEVVGSGKDLEVRLRGQIGVFRISIRFSQPSRGRLCARGF